MLSVGRRGRIVLEDFVHREVLTVRVQTETVGGRSLVAGGVHVHVLSSLVQDHHFHEVTVLIRWRMRVTAAVRLFRANGHVVHARLVVDERRRVLFVETKQRRGFLAPFVVVRQGDLQIVTGITIVVVEQVAIELVDLTALVEIDQSAFDVGVLNRRGALDRLRWRLGEGRRRRRRDGRFGFRDENDRRSGVTVVGCVARCASRNRFGDRFQQCFGRHVAQTAVTDGRRLAVRTRVGYQFDTIVNGRLEDDLVCVLMVAVDFVDLSIDAVLVVDGGFG